MKKLNMKFEYDGHMDKEVIPLCNAMNSLPGIETDESCCGHGSSKFSIFFKVKGTDKGLFFLTRCVDRRYWKYGYLWKIELSVGDRFKDNYLPIFYELHSGPIVGEDSYNQANSLVDNLNHHLNHEAFLKEYKIENIIKEIK